MDHRTEITQLFNVVKYVGQPMGTMQIINKLQLIASQIMYFRSFYCCCCSCCSSIKYQGSGPATKKLKN